MSIMEEKRIVWIAAAVGIFLCVVLLSAALISRGQEDKHIIASYKNTSRLAAESGASRDSSRAAADGTSEAKQNGGNETSSGAGWTKEGVVPAAHVDDMTVVAQNATVFAIKKEDKEYSNSKYSLPLDTIEEDKGIDLNQIGKNAPRSDEANAPNSIYVGTNDEKNGINIAKTETDTSTKTAETASAKSPVSRVSANNTNKTLPKANASRANSVAPASKESSVAAKSAPVVRKVVKENTSTPQKTSAPKKTAVQKSESTPQTWWVQAASFTNLKYADNARGTLKQNNITADVFTYKDSLGKVFYRVRVGPYLTKSEAEYWQSRIGQIETFRTTQSFVTRG